MVPTKVRYQVPSFFFGLKKKILETWWAQPQFLQRGDFPTIFRVYDPSFYTIFMPFWTQHSLFCSGKTIPDLFAHIHPVLSVWVWYLTRRMSKVIQSLRNHWRRSSTEISGLTLYNSAARSGSKWAFIDPENDRTIRVWDAPLKMISSNWLQVAITKHFRYLKWRVSWALCSAILGVGETPLHKPYPYCLYRWGFLHFRYLKSLVIESPIPRSTGLSWSTHHGSCLSNLCLSCPSCPSS